MFELTPEKKSLRIQVANDVLGMIAAQVITPTTGTYFNFKLWKDQPARVSSEPALSRLMKLVKKPSEKTGKPECKACALGSLLLAQIAHDDRPFPTKEYGRNAEAPTRGFSLVPGHMRDRLEEIFSPRELGRFEAIFELKDVYVVEDNEHAEERLCELLYHQDLLDGCMTPKERLLWMMQTLIAQKGEEWDPYETTVGKYLEDSIKGTGPYFIYETVPSAHNPGYTKVWVPRAGTANAEIPSGTSPLPVAERMLDAWLRQKLAEGSSRSYPTKASYPGLDDSPPRLNMDPELAFRVYALLPLGICTDPGLLPPYFTPLETPPGENAPMVITPTEETPAE